MDEGTIRNVAPVLFLNRPGYLCFPHDPSVSNRRSFFLSAASLAGAAAISSNLIAQPAPTNLTAFLGVYDDAWASHDPLAIAMLHSEDVLVVNRFGAMLEGRAEVQTAMQFLHGPGGPFHTMTFPRQELLVSRMLNSNMATLHARWKNPTMGPGDQLAHGSQTPWVDMLSTYLLARQGETWQIVQHDLHSVDPIKFPTEVSLTRSALTVKRFPALHARLKQQRCHGATVADE